MKEFKNIAIGILAADHAGGGGAGWWDQRLCIQRKNFIFRSECDGGAGVQRQCEDLLSGWKSRGIRRGTFL